MRIRDRNRSDAVVELVVLHWTLGELNHLSEITGNPAGQWYVAYADRC
jgi:hypothetical protein